MADQADYSQESTRRSVTVDAGAGAIALNYYEAGPADGAAPVGGGLPFVLLHGGGPGASAWSNFGSALPRFALSFRTLLLDQPGFGATPAPDEAWGSKEYAEWLAQILEGLEGNGPDAEAPIMVGLRYRPGQNPVLAREWTSDAVGGGPLASPVMSALAKGSTQPCTSSSSARRRHASSTAHRRAARLSSEPSTPATGLSTMLLSMVKTAAFKPMPSVSTPTTVNQTESGTLGGRMRRPIML